jgi:hypothetical protein
MRWSSCTEAWFWTGSGWMLDADGFAAFDRPSYAKVVWDFRLTPPANGYSMSGTLALA